MSENQIEPSLPVPLDRSRSQFETRGLVPGEDLGGLTEATPLSPNPGSGGWFPSAGTLLLACRQRWLLAATVGLLLAAVAAPVVWYLRPVNYTVFTLLRVAAKEPRVLPGEQVSEGSLFRQTQVALVTSRPVIMSALRNGKIGELEVLAREEDPASWLEKNLAVGFLEGTEILRIAMIGRDPDQLKVLVSAIEKAYLDEAVNAERTQRVLRLDEIQKICDKSEEKIRTQREKLRRLAESMKTSDTQALTLRQRILLDEYAALKREHVGVQSEIRHLKEVIATQEAKQKALKTQTFKDEQINDYLLETDPHVRRAADEVERLEWVVRRSKELAKAGRTIPAEADLKAAQRQLEKTRADQRPAGTERMRKQALAQSTTQLEQATDRLKVAVGQEAAFKMEVEAKAKEADAIGITSIEVEIRRGEIEQAEAVIRTLRSEKERLDVELLSTARRVTPLSQDGDVYQTKNAKARIATTLSGGFVAFLLGGLMVGLWESSRRRIHSPVEVVRDLGLKVWGTLPGLPPCMLGRSEGAKTDARSRSLWLECVTGLRTTLILGAKGGLPRILMLTSASSGEGKTTLAANLAVSIASTGRTTLLIDCDLRRPVLHKVFEEPISPGFSDVLRGEADCRAAIRPTKVHGLYFLPAGEVSREALGALSRDGARALLEELKESFDCILLDTSPVLPVADALLVGQHADGVLLAIRPRVSRVPRVQAACERLQSLNVRFVGAVVNGAYDHLDAEDYKYLRQK